MSGKVKHDDASDESAKVGGYVTAASLLMRHVSLRRSPGRLLAHVSRPLLLAALTHLSACAGPVGEPGRPGFGRTIYFSDCEAGAAVGCVRGDDSNPGTQAAPKRDLASIEMNSLPAGTTLLLKRGGAWKSGRIVLENKDVTADKPLIFDAYGTGPAPILIRSNGTLFEFGNWQSQINDGGYTFRNLKIDGLGSAQWGFWLRDFVHHVTIENVEISGFDIAIHAGGDVPPGITFLTLRNSHIHHNRTQGMLAKIHKSIIEGNLFEANNPSGSAFNHAIYLSGGNGNTIRNNKLLRNSVVNGACAGGNFTLHGQVDGMLIEGNTIEQDLALGGCYGFSITPGYSYDEWFRNVVVRNNTVINVGHCAICAGAAPGIVIENNTLVNRQPIFQIAIHIPVGKKTSGDAEDTGAVVRNNTVCFSAPHPDGAGVRVGGSSALGNNVLLTGADARKGVCAP